MRRDLRSSKGDAMAERETELQRASCLLSVRVPPDLYQAIARDAASLGVSMSDAGRMRLRSGSVPLMNRKD
jgi:hypothetical protein